MSKYNSTLRHPLHSLTVYYFSFQSYISCTYTINLFHFHRKQKMGLKWASQLITEIWKVIYVKWLHRSKLKHAREVMDNHTKELILDSEITDKHKQGQYKLTYRYNPYFSTCLFTILDTSITARKDWYCTIKTAQEMTSTEDYTIFLASKPLCTWQEIQSLPSLSTSK